MVPDKADRSREALTGEEARVAPLGDGVRQRREQLRLRQSELADLAGCSTRFVHTLEHGKPTLRLDKVLDVLEVLGLDLLVAPGRGRVVLRPVGGRTAGADPGPGEDP